MTTKKERLLLFCLLLCCLASIGVFSSLFGLSLLELAQNLNVSIQQVSYGVTVAFICGCLGSLFGTYLLDKWNRQILLSLACLICAIDFVILPFLTSFTLYLINNGITGFVSPLINVTLSVWIMEMFESKSKIYLQILHLFYPIGQMLGPIIYVPFVGESNSTSLNVTRNNASNSQFISTFDDLFGAAKYSNLWKPYLITGAFLTSISALSMIAFFIKPYRKPSKKIDPAKKDWLSDPKCELSNKYKIFFIFFICIWAAIQVSNEFSTITLIPTYLQKSALKLDKIKASYCQGILSTAMMTGRVLNIFVTIKINTQAMLFINFFLMILGNSVILAIGSHSIQAVYVGIALLGYGISNSYPMILAFVDERITLTNSIMSLMSFPAAILVASLPFTLSRFLDTNPSYFIGINLSITCFAFLIYVLLLVAEKLRLRSSIRSEV